MYYVSDMVFYNRMQLVSSRWILFIIFGILFISGVAVGATAISRPSSETPFDEVLSDGVETVTEELSNEAEDDSINSTSTNTGRPTMNTSSSSSDSDTSSGDATVDGFDDFGACDEDAHEYCSGFYGGDWASWADEYGYISASWKLGLVDCLGDHQDDVSDECNASLDRRQVLNDEMNEACAIDRGKYCAGVKPSPGSEPQVDCLKEHYGELSAACVEALDAHEAAKPAGE